MDRGRKMDLSAIRTFLPVSEFSLFHPDPNINFQFNRFLIPSYERLFAQLGAKIHNFGDWKREFLKVAADFEQRGMLGEASALYRAAEFFIGPDDPDRRIAFEKFIDLFYQGPGTKEIERFTAGYERAKLHGFKLAAQGVGRGTILIHGGFDSYCEEFYDYARVVASCGYDVVIFDGPGQGSTLMNEHLPMTPEWHRPVSAVLDQLNLAEVTLIGISLGGCLALRAAAFEPRIRSVVAFDVMLDFFQCVTSRRGKIIEKAIRALLSLHLTGLLNRLGHSIMARDLYARWGVQQGMHVTGASHPAQFFSKLRAYNTRDISDKITQHVLIMAGAEDHFVPLQQCFLQLPLLTNAKSVSAEIFTRNEQASAHCQVGNKAIAIYRIMNWMQTRTA
jgi:pimeloyl-ACP methyl ester carboxylesterase